MPVQYLKWILAFARMTMPFQSLTVSGIENNIAPMRGWISWGTRIALFDAVILWGPMTLALKWLPRSQAFAFTCAFFILAWIGLILHFRAVMNWSMKGLTQRAVKHFLAWWFFLPPVQYQHQLIDLLLIADDVETAEAAIDSCESKKICPPYWIEYFRGNMERKSKRFPAAEKHYRTAISEARSEFQKSIFKTELAWMYINYQYDRPEKLETARNLLHESEPMLQKKASLTFKGIQAALDVRSGKYERAAETLQATIPRIKSNALMSPQLLSFAAEQLYYAGLAEKALGHVDEAQNTWEYGLSLTKYNEINERINVELKKLLRNREAGHG